MKVEHVSQLGGSPYLAFAIEAHDHLLKRGLADPGSQLVSWDNRAVVARRDDGYGSVRGIITYLKQDYLKTFAILIGYVPENQRHRGVYHMLWDSLVKKAREEEILVITGVTKMTNTTMREVAKKLGRVEESVNLHFEVPK